jgi:hypothetical protein
MIPSILHSGNVGIAEVKGNNISTMFLLPSEAANSIGVLPNCKSNGKVFLELIITQYKYYVDVPF